MLTLTRRVGEAIWIGDVRIIIREIRGKQVRIGFEADASVKIQREELRNKEEAEKENTS